MFSAKMFEPCFLRCFDTREVINKVIHLMESREFPSDYKGFEQRVTVDARILHDIFCDLQMNGMVSLRWRKDK